MLGIMKAIVVNDVYREGRIPCSVSGNVVTVSALAIYNSTISVTNGRSERESAFLGLRVR